MTCAPRPERDRFMTLSTLPTMRIALPLALVLLAPLAPAHDARAQQPARPGAASPQTGAAVSISLDDALRMAQATSQSIEVARSGVVRASGTRLQARSQYFPQLNASASYNKTLQSQFASFANS